jgi:hypothetical protein
MKREGSSRGKKEKLTLIADLTRALAFLTEDARSFPEVSHWAICPTFTDLKSVTVYWPSGKECHLQ